VHSSYGAFALTVDNVGLSNYRIQAVIRELALAEGPRKEAAIIFAAFELKDERSFEFGLEKPHQVLRPAPASINERA
jgi:hypothetical protein